MERIAAKTTLQKEILRLEKQTSITFAIFATVFFLLTGTLLEILISVAFDKMVFLQALQAFHFQKLFLMAGVFLPAYYFGVMKKDRKLLQQKKQELQNANQH